MKYNLSTIARRANSLAADMGKSLAFKKAWAEAKIERLEKAMYAPENSRPAQWMPIREELLAMRDALYAINQEAEAANPTMAMKNRLFILRMADRPSYEEREEIYRLEKLLAA